MVAGCGNLGGICAGHGVKRCRLLPPKPKPDVVGPCPDFRVRDAAYFSAATLDKPDVGKPFGQVFSPANVREIGSLASLRQKEPARTLEPLGRCGQPCMLPRPKR